MAGVGEIGGVSPFGSPPRTQEEEQAGTESDAQSDSAVGSGLGPTAPIGGSVGFSSVSSSDGGGSGTEAGNAANHRKIRLQLRAAHTSLKENIQEESTVVTEIIRDRTSRLSARLPAVDEWTENLKVSHDECKP